MEIKRNQKKYQGPRKPNFFQRVLEILTAPIGSFGREKESLIENLSMLIGSGLDVLAALELVKFDVHSPRMFRLVQNLKAEIETGSTMWGALTAGKVLPDYMIALIRVGEESGRLSENLKIIVLQQRKNKSFKSKLVSALIYPAIIFVLSIVIGIAIFIFVIPRLATVYAALSIELPVITQFMISVSIFLSNYWLIVIPLTSIGVYLLYYFLFMHPRYKRIGQKMIFSIGPFRNIILNVEMARFGFLFGTLISAGLPILDAITSLSRSSDFYAYQQFYDFLEEHIEEGMSFKQCFEKYKKINDIMPVPIQQIIIAAESSGRIKESMQQIYETFEERIDISSKNLSVILEPVMLIIVWLGVVFVALSVIFPIYNLVGGVSQSTRGVISKGSNQATETLVTTGNVRIKENLENAHILEFPDKAAMVLEVGRGGTVYRLIKLEDGWYQVLLTGSSKTGWIDALLVDDISDQE